MVDPPRSLADLFDTTEPIHQGDRRGIPVHLPEVQRAAGIVDSSGVPDMIAAWRTADGRDPAQGGRPALLDDRQILTLLLILALEGTPLTLTRALCLVRDRLTANATAWLGLPRDDASGTAWYSRIHRAFRRAVGPIDPHLGTPRRRRLTRDEMAAVRERRDPAFVHVRDERLHRALNALVWASIMAARAGDLAGWSGTVAVDATPVVAVKNGTTAKSRRCSSEPDAGWYVRSHDTRDDSPGRDSIHWAWDLTIAIMAGAADLSFPRLILGAGVDRPGHRPAELARIAMRNVLASDLPRGFFVGDRIYHPGPRPEALQIPMRRAGYRLLGSQIKGQTGIQGRYAGAQLVDGDWYCPAMPKALVEATTDLRDQTIDKDTWTARIDRRGRYLLRPKEAPHRDGSQRWVCPAVGPGATCDCPLRPLLRAMPAGARTRILSRDLPLHPGRLCTNRRSVTIPIEAGAKYAQQGPQWGTDAWHAAYTVPRQTVESANASLKAGDHEVLADRKRRMVRGLAAQALIVGLLIVSHNIRALQTSRRTTEQETRGPLQPARRAATDIPMDDLLLDEPEASPQAA